MQKMGKREKKKEKKKKRKKTEHSDWLGTHREPIRLEQMTGPNNNETKWRPLSEDLDRTKIY